MKFVEYILILGAVQGLLLSILLFTRKANHTANVILAAAVLALSLDVFQTAYLLFEYYEAFPHFTGITYPFPFLYGPIFYIYAKLLSSEENKFKPKYLLHFIPFALVVLYGVIFVYSKSSDFKLSLIRNELAEPLPFLNLITLLKPFHGIIYVFFTVKLVKNFNQKLRNSYSNIEKINLSWLKHLAIGLSIIWGIVAVTYILNAVYDDDIIMDAIIYIAVSILIYSIGYLSLRQPQILYPSLAATGPSLFPEKKEKGGISGYQKSGLKNVDAEKNIQTLLNVMDSEKPYLKSELTLRDLADRLSMSPHNLSEILNTRLNKNFYDFINGYRVEEVKRRLKSDSQKYSLIAIAFDSGFNSKSSFNTIFKKHTGTTPSDFRKQLT